MADDEAAQPGEMSRHGYRRPIPPETPEPEQPPGTWDSLDGLPEDAQKTKKFKRQWHDTAEKDGGRAVIGIEGEPGQCTAFVSATGERCRHKSIIGGTVCPKHGGTRPDVKRKAALRLAEMVNPALFVLGKIMMDDEAKHADRLRAVENVLDRAGHSRAVTHVTEAEAQDLLAQKLREAVAEMPPE